MYSADEGHIFLSVCRVLRIQRIEVLLLIVGNLVLSKQTVMASTFELHEALALVFEWTMNNFSHGW